LGQLETVILMDCPELSDITGLQALKRLNGLSLSKCPKVTPESIAALRAALPAAIIEHR
jgi:hypothetical protein